MPTKTTTFALYIVALVGIVNALSYAVIIPLLYPYAKQFGFDASGSGLLFASFALAQFLATPIIGRLSDLQGRKIWLAISVFGTSVSQLLMAVAWNAPSLLFARILDGITGGNNSVAQAVISDTVEPAGRAKWFGVLGAAFGLGFLVGPAIGGYLSMYSLRAPFFLGALLALLATLLIIFFLTETLPPGGRESSGKPLFDFKALAAAVFEPYVGQLFLSSFLINVAFSIFILGFQSFTTDILMLSTGQIALLFTIFGFIGLLFQGGLVGIAVRKFKEFPLLCFGIIVTVIGFTMMGFARDLNAFILASVVVAIGNSFNMPIITSLLSKHVRKEDQGGAMGINQSYISLGTIFGPLLGGQLTEYSASGAFFGAAVCLSLVLISVLLLARDSKRHLVDL